jgi:hypothetical protein
MIRGKGGKRSSALPLMGNVRCPKSVYVALIGIETGRGPATLCRGWAGDERGRRAHQWQCRGGTIGIIWR